MKLEMDRSALFEVASRGGSAAARGGVIPVLLHARLTARGGKVLATSTDLTSEAKAFAEASIEVEGEVCVPADSLKLFVDRLPATAVVKIELAGRDLVVSAKRQRAKLPTIAAADFPAFDFLAGEADADFVLSAAELHTLFARTVPAASGDSSRFYLKGVFLAVVANGTKLRATATDGHHLLQTEIDAPLGSTTLPAHGDGGRLAVIVPTEAVLSALKLFGRADSVHVLVSKAGIVFKGERSSYSSKLIDGTYPDIDRVIPPAFGGDPELPMATLGAITLDRASCASAIASIEVFNASKESSRAIEFGVDDEGLAMAAGSTSDGNGFAVADAEFEGEVPAFSAASTYFKAVLSAFQAETVRLSFRDAGSPLRFDSASEPTIGIVMPMRGKGLLAEVRK